MRRVSALALLFTLSATSVVPTFAQKRVAPRADLLPTPIESERSPAPVKSVKNGAKGILNSPATQFAVSEAYAAGEGAWVYWRMASETNNLGFRVYRIDGKGETQIGEFVPGAAMKYSYESINGEQYSQFDPNGTAGSVYFVEAVNTDGGSLRALPTGTKRVKKLPTIGGMFERPPAADELSRPVSTDLALPQELRAERGGGDVEPDSNRHKQIVAMPGVRIAAKGSGLVRVTKAQLQNAGFDVNSDPANWQLYLDGHEQAIIVGPNADHIEFFGKTLDTVESDIRTFYLVSGNSAGKRFRVDTPRPSPRSVVSRRYFQSQTLKERTFYSQNILNGDDENWWGGAVLNGSFKELQIPLTGVDRFQADRQITVGFQGFSLTPHDVKVWLNGHALPSVTGFARERFSATFTIPQEFLKEHSPSDPNILRMTTASAGDSVLFDFVTIDYPRAYVAVNNKLDFYTENYRRTIMSGFSSANVRLFDFTNPAEPIEIVNNQIVETNGTFGPVVPSSRGRVYHAMEASAVGTPVSVLPNDPAMLEDPANAATLVIITHRTLMTQAQAWAAYRAGQGVSTKLIDVDEIYDEFSFGTSSSYAIEDFLNYAKYNWQTPPSYVLLIGDATFDPKNYSNNGYWNMVPTRIVNTLFEETGSDEALADFDNDGLAEIAIGRVSSRTSAGVTTVLNKTINWEANLGSNPLDRGAMFTYDLPIGFDFEAMSNRVMSELPPSMPKVSVGRGNDGPSQAAAKAALISGFNTAGSPTTPGGKYIVNFTGHGTSGAWGGVDFFTNLDVPMLSNSSQPSLVTALTCLNAYFIPANANDSLAESLTKAPNGGAVAIWASTGRTTPDVQEIMAQRFYEQIVIGNIPRIGDLIMDAKTQLIGGGDVRLSWALVGDPMLKVR